MTDHVLNRPRSGPAAPRVGGYRRALPVSLERLYENALDWQHLPHLHASRFAGVRCLDYGPWGWRAEVRNVGGAAAIIELVLDRASRRWVTTVLDGAGAGSEIWTHAFVVAERQVDIVVDFFVPGVAEPDRERVGAAYAALYAQLYDEDVAMMVARQRQLDRRIDGARDAEHVLDLGLLEALRLPLGFELGGREFVLDALGDSVVAFPARCPHQLGPLGLDAREDGVVVCPWHGYRFDARSGENLAGGTCRLAPLPSVSVGADGRVRVQWRRKNGGAELDGSVPAGVREG